MDFFASLWETLRMESLDRQLFVLINSEWTHPFLDMFMPWITDLHKNGLIVAIAVPTLLALWYYRNRKQMLVALVGLLLCIALVDNFIHRVMKPYFGRQRPPHVEKVIELRTDRYGGLSFPSNHAANNFASAAFLSSCYPALSPVFFTVAGIVAYSRVYVGVHYPADVLVGSLIGLIFGLLFFRIWRIILVRVNRRWALIPLLTENPLKGDTHGEFD